MENSPKSSLSLIFGYFFSGLLLGYISGITSSEISQTILTALFAFIGGKVLNDIGKKSYQQLSQIGHILIAFSIAFIFGLNGGIAVKINRLLSFKLKNNIEELTNQYQPPIMYLRANDSVKTDLESKYKKGEISKDSIIAIFFKKSR